MIGFSGVLNRVISVHVYIEVVFKCSRKIMLYRSRDSRRFRLSIKNNESETDLPVKIC